MDGQGIGQWLFLPGRPPLFYLKDTSSLKLVRRGFFLHVIFCHSCSTCCITECITFVLYVWLPLSQTCLPDPFAHLGHLRWDLANQILEQMKANSLQYCNSAAYLTHFLCILKIHHWIISVAKTVLHLLVSDGFLYMNSRSIEYFSYWGPWLYIKILSSILSINLACLCLAVAVHAGMATIPRTWQLWTSEGVVEAGSSVTGIKGWNIP